MFAGSRVETVRVLKVYDLLDKPFARVDKGAEGKIATFVMPSDPKVDVRFDDGRMFSIPKRWLKEVR